LMPWSVQLKSTTKVAIWYLLWGEVQNLRWLSGNCTP
jgi:hypothetical protein